MCLAWRVLKRVVRSRPISIRVSDYLSGERGQEPEAGSTYSYFEINKFLRECAHLIVEAKSVFSSLACGEDEVSLSLLFPIHDDLVPRSHNLVIDIEGASCLNLREQLD